MRRVLHVFLPALLCILLIASCKKEEGEGGNSTISGKVFIREYNQNFTFKIEQYYAPDEDVFIVYGDDDVYGDKTSTHSDGTYRFKYLREGEYTVFAYSEDSVNYPTNRKIPVIQHVKISGKNKEVKVPDIVILNN